MKYNETNAKHYVFTQLPELNENGKRILIDIIKPFDVIVTKTIELQHACLVNKFQASAPVLYEIYDDDENAEIAVEKLGFKISQLFYRAYSHQKNVNGSNMVRHDLRFQYRFLSNYLSLTIE